MRFLAELIGCAQTTLCVNSSLVVVVGGVPLCMYVCVFVCMCWLMGSQQGARPTYNRLLLPSPPPLRLVSPITLYHPHLIWQPRRRRAATTVTEGRCSSSNIPLMTLFPSLITLSLCSALTYPLLPCFLLPAILSWVLTSPPPFRLLTVRDGSYKPQRCKTPCQFCFVCPFFSSLSESELSTVFFFTFPFELIWNLKSCWECHQDRQTQKWVSAWHTSFQPFSPLGLNIHSDVRYPSTPFHALILILCFRSGFTWTWHSDFPRIHKEK